MPASAIAEALTIGILTGLIVAIASQWLRLDRRVATLDWQEMVDALYTSPRNHDDYSRDCGNRS